MSTLTEFLFPAPARRTVGAIVGWWEERRLRFNAIVGGAGATSLAISTVIAHMPPGAHVDAPLLPPWQPVVTFGLLANLCYLLGPTVEVAIDKVWGRQVLPVGPTLFRMGLTFSVGLALFPTLLFSLDWIFRVLRLVF